MRILTILIVLLHLFVSLPTATCQLSFDSKVGIENPFLYEYDIDFFPSDPSYRNQEFKFFRSKIYSVGSSYTVNITKNKKFAANIGTQLGLMTQYLADTIIDPSWDHLIYNAKLRLVYLETGLSLTYRPINNFDVNFGIDGFLPLQKRIISSEENIRYQDENGKGFYNSTLYARIAIKYRIQKYSIGLEFQDTGGSRSRLWVRWPANYSRGGPSHLLQRWFLTFSYSLK